MTTAIIGAGNVGTALARRFSEAGVHVVIANRAGPDAIRPTLEGYTSGVDAVTLGEALDAETLILAIPFMGIEELARGRDDWTGKTIIDATNAYGASPEYLAGRLSSDIVAEAFPGAAVVKSFNQLPAALLARDPADLGGRRVMFVAGNDDDATGAVKVLVEQLGFSAISLGRLDGGGSMLGLSGPLILHNFIEHPLK